MTSLVSSARAASADCSQPPFHPTDLSGRFYVALTNTNGDIELDEFKRQAGDPTRADPATRRILLTIPHPGATNHNGGQLQFGPRDGHLYMSTGDGGNIDPPGEPARDLEDLRGTILRIKPDGAQITGNSSRLVPP